MEFVHQTAIEKSKNKSVWLRNFGGAAENSSYCFLTEDVSPDQAPIILNCTTRENVRLFKQSNAAARNKQVHSS